MERINFNPERFQNPKTTVRAQNAFEDLINQIVEQCKVTPTQAASLRRRLAIAARTAKWDETDLHALLQKRNDPAVRNFTGLVSWYAKVQNAA